MPPQDQSHKANWYLVLVFALLTLGIISAGYLYFQKQREHLTGSKKNDMAAIVDLKMGQIDAWRKERLADARMIYDNRLLAARVQQLLKDPDSRRLEDELPGWMALREKNEQYAMGFLFDAEGKLRCAVQGASAHQLSETPAHVLEALHSRTIAFSDLQHADSAGGAYLDLLVPLVIPRQRAGGEASQTDTATAGLLVLRIDPAGVLYPLIQAWPLPSRTAESFLLRQRGDVFQYMNPPEELKGTLADFRLADGTDKFPAAMFVRGDEQTFIGPDFRDVQVMATLRKIPNSNWLLVAKVDLDEIYAPIRELSYWATILVVVLMFAAWAIVAAIWRRQRADFYRKQFETEVERHALEKHHAFLTKYANDIILLMDQNLMIQDANDRALSSYGYSRKELFALSAVELHVPEAQDGYGKYVQALQHDGAAVIETVHRRKDGTRFPVEISSRVIRVDEKVFYQSIMRDITQRKLAEQAMLESEARFRAVFEKAGIGIALTEPGGRFLETNHALHEMFGYDAEELKQFTFDMLLHPGERQQGAQLEDQGGPEHLNDHIRAERRYLHKDGHIVWARPTSTVVHNADGKPQYGLTMLTNITRWKKAEEERRNLEAQVMQMQKMESIGTLAGGVAHDFNNILGIILGHCSLIARVIHDPARVSKSIDAMNKAVQRGASLVRQILTFARKTDVQFEQVRLADVINEFVRMLEETFPKTISFEVALENKSAIIDADRTQVHQTLLNLCVNARDAMPNGGTISITMDQFSGTALRERFPDATTPCYERIRIADTGAGMDEQTLQRIFEPFFTTKERGKGTGLGLAVVYGIIRSHHGFIDVESRVGKGTTFSLYFPLPGVQAEAPSNPAGGEEDAVPGGEETVLVVEDEEMLRDIVCNLLNGRGYTVIAAGDGEEAVKTYGEKWKNIDLVITDMGLPRLSGADAFAEMRRINPSARIILASGYVEPQIKTALMADGARAFIQKPYAPAEVLQVVRTTIDEKA